MTHARCKLSVCGALGKSLQRFPGQKSSFHVSDIHAEEHTGRRRFDSTSKQSANDAGMQPQSSDVLLFLDQYMLMQDEDKLQRYTVAFNDCNVAHKAQKILILPEVIGALKKVHNNRISDKECQFCLMALDMIKQTGKGSQALTYDFHTFSVIATLSDRIHDAEDVLEPHFKQLDFNDFEALQHKILRARAVFYLAEGAQETGSMTFESLRNTCIAGHIDQAIPHAIIKSMKAGHKHDVDFLDFLAYLPMFMHAHETMTSDERILGRPERLQSQSTLQNTSCS